jgi:hypothetical protein
VGKEARDGASAGKNGPVRTLTQDEIARLSYTPPPRPALPARPARRTAHAKNRTVRKEERWNKRRRTFDEHVNVDRRPNHAVEDVLIAAIDCHTQQHDEAMEIDAWAIAGHGETEAKPRARAKARHGQRTTLQRASAWVNGEVGLARFGFTAEDLTLALGVVVVDPAEPARSDLNRLEHARFTVAVLDAAHRFYQATRVAFPSRTALETAFSEWTPAVSQWQVRHRQAVKATLAKGLNGRDLTEEVWRLSGPGPMPPAELRPVLALANILPRGALKVLGRERGKGAGGWAGNTRVTVLVGGSHVCGKRAVVDQTRHVVVDLLAPEWLDVLYGSGRRAGAREAAKAVTADIVGRSRAGVENLTNAARADTR